MNENTKLIKVSEIREGMRIVMGKTIYYAYSDAYTHNGTWSFMCFSDERYGFSSNPNEIVSVILDEDD